MFQTTRRRLALWYTTVTAILLLVFATGFYFYVRNTLIDRIDDTLKHVVEVVERSLVISPNSQGGLRVNVEASFRNNTNAVEDDHIDLEWFSPTGELLWATFSESLNLPLHPNRTGETVHLVGNSHELWLRQITERVEYGRQVLGYLRVSHPWFEFTKPIRQLIWDLSVGTAVMAIGVGVIGWLLSGLAIAPVRESYQRLKQFTADASHELRSPIAIIQTNVQVALADPNLESATQRLQLQMIERLTRRLGRLVDDLLFLARQDSGIVQPNWETVHLDELLISVISEQQAIATEKGITLFLDIATPQEFSPELEAEIVSTGDRGNIFSLRGDSQQLTRLFTNLLTNALQYTPTGGDIEVKLQCDPLNFRQGQSPPLQIKVRDTGIGIPAESLPQIFERFYRVDPARHHSHQSEAKFSPTGSGLGLAIARAIVENHQGQIHISSEVDRGTTVTVILPGKKFPD
ncbi:MULTISPECIES: sensor histidine kinase [Planktothricoides]|uniref:histidine kinase n=2 Tax=Planktothricoides raciborskii TaxID=132608 RepID=A0AAU8JH57_9CYAN|nr:MULTISPECIES: ATP-binding protein [Planktothricoides]KOR35236.1 histidine kinase [Planktothricoides sp. SR001]MBD2544792.1 two-component sensor histidine kinase [Planktothricoides raciborskii FACHB-1370]MBD2582801.1 two-component sensor histidine kinase [Planktothricoides raciborskii FACHB-1261]